MNNNLVIKSILYLKIRKKYKIKIDLKPNKYVLVQNFFLIISILTFRNIKNFKITIFVLLIFYI